MKKTFSLLMIVFCVALCQGCGIFKGGCKCPPVSYNNLP